MILSSKNNLYKYTNTGLLENRSCGNIFAKRKILTNCSKRNEH